MKTSRWLGVILCAMLVVGHASTAGAQESQDAGQNPGCMRQFLERSAPYVQQMLWYADQASNYPLSPQARPLVTGWPYSAYGPGNGYGPGSPYGPAFGPWGVGSFGPGFGGPFGYGLGPTGVGGPAWGAANAPAPTRGGALARTPPGP